MALQNHLPIIPLTKPAPAWQEGDSSPQATMLLPPAMPSSFVQGEGGGGSALCLK